MKIFTPVPHPGLALFGAVLGFFAFISYQFTLEAEFAAVRTVFTGAAIVLAFISLVCLVNFFWGLRLDLSLGKEGLTTTARITRIEECHGGKGRPALWWQIHFTFMDASGRQQESSYDETDAEAGRKWKVGDSVRIRFHPAAPSIYRWLDS